MLFLFDLGDEENAATVDPKEAELLQKPVHSENDVVPVQPDQIDETQLQLSRKVAQGPPGPTYKGENSNQIVHVFAILHVMHIK